MLELLEPQCDIALTHPESLIAEWGAVVNVP